MIIAIIISCLIVTIIIFILALCKCASLADKTYEEYEINKRNDNKK